MKQFSNAWHPHAGKEWWYFTLLCSDIVIAGCISVKKKGEVWLSVYSRKQVERWKNGLSFKGRTDNCNVDAGQSYFYEKDGKCFVRIRIKDVNLEFSGTADYTFADNTIAIENINWIIPILKGKASGEISIKGQRKKIEGVLFHDHVLVQPNLKSLQLKGWIWGILYHETETILYVRVDATKKHCIIFHEKNGAVRKVQGDVLVRKDHKQVMIEFEDKVYVSAIDRLYRVLYPYSNKLVRSVVSMFGVRKFHGYNRKRNEYMECLRIRS